MSHQPQMHSEKFACPRCGVVAQQRWLDVRHIGAAARRMLEQYFLDYRKNISDYQQETIEKYLPLAGAMLTRSLEALMPAEFSVSTCVACSRGSIWVNGELVFPLHVDVGPANQDMSEEIRALYDEAASVYVASPRGAAALLRLAVQLLMRQVGKKGEDLNAEIGQLVAGGLSPKIQQALDLLRVIGNNAVHPGQIVLEDNREVALRLFEILNVVADELITRPREIESMYNNVVPEGARAQISKRDRKND